MPRAWKSEKHKPVCFVSTAGHFVLLSAEYLLGRRVADALRAVDGQQTSCEQQAILFAAVADAVSELLMSHFQTCT